MAARILKFFGEGAQACARGAVTLVFWTLWLALSLLLALQIYVARTHELGVPRFVRTMLVERLDRAGIHAAFGRTTFDPSGRILIENVRLTLPGFEEPVVTARALYLRIDPWALVVRRFKPYELRVTGANLRVPAMLSPSGRADEVVRDLDVGAVPSAGGLSIEYLTCHLGDLAVSAHGDVPLGRAAGHTGVPSLAEFLAGNYGPLTSRAAAVVAALGGLDEPVLRVAFSPALVRADFCARGLKLAAPLDVRAGPIEARARIPLLVDTTADVEVSARGEELEVAGVSVRGLSARLRGRLAPQWWREGKSPFSAAGLDLAAGRASVLGVALECPVAGLEGTAPVQAVLRARVWSQVLSVQARVDPRARSAECRFQGDVGPGVLDAVGARFHRDLRKFVDFSSPVAVDGEARFGPGWRFEGVTAQVSGRAIKAYGVVIDKVGGRVEFDGRRFVAPEAYARLGEDFARGSYEQDLVSRDYRFVLKGRLRPLDITPWILGGWWKEFFGNFEFPAEPPAASVDLQGRWTDGRRVSVFVEADSAAPVVRGVPFDRVRTRLFIRPQFKDILDLDAERGPGSISGRFVHRMDLDDKSKWNAELDLTSSIELDKLASILGSAGIRFAGAFASDRPPVVRVSGSASGAGSPGGAHATLRVEGREDGTLRYQGFPLERVMFVAEVRDDVIEIAPLSGGFAGGAFSGKARLWGRDAARRLKFEGKLGGASLAQAVTTLEAFSAERGHRAPRPLEEFHKGKSNMSLDIAASGEGLFSDPFSYQGSGTASLQGPELGQVRLLGLLSELLRFTSLRFTTARASFAIEGHRLNFSSVSVTGANSGITAHGTYALDKHELDFNARIDPFQQSKAFPQQFIGAVLTPLTNVFEVKLTGSIEKPRWMFANGPSNLLRNLAEPEVPAPAQLK